MYIKKSKKKHYWPNIKKQIEAVINKCEICQKFNRKKGNKNEFVTSSRPFEKVALDLIDMRREGIYILVGIDYFSRFIVTKSIKDKSAKTVCDVIKEWIGLGYIPETLISDNGREFMNEEFKSMCQSMGIEHHLVGIEAHRSNGRVERVVRTIRDAAVKLGHEMPIEDKIEMITEKYNRTYHIGIKSTPLEALTETKCETVVNNMTDGPYSKRFGKRINDAEYVKGDVVRL
ncbi:LTR Retrotransposon, partial [Pseudoloma neurophilia]